MCFYIRRGSEWQLKYFIQILLLRCMKKRMELTTAMFDVHMDQEMRHKRKYLDPKRIYSLRILVQSTQEAELVNGKWRLGTLVLTYSRFVLFTDQYTFVHLSCSGV